MKRNPLAKYDKTLVELVRREYWGRSDYPYVASRISERLNMDVSESDVAIVSLALKNGWGRVRR